MTELDQALETLRQDMNDARSQSKFYDLFLNTTYLVPKLDEQDSIGTDEGAADGQVLPLVIESEGMTT